MIYETINFSVDARIARLTLNRPDRLNSFTVQMHEEVRDALTRTVAEGARCLLLSGAGRGFCAGQDLSDRAVAPTGGKVDLGDSVERFYNPLIRTLTALQMPVIAAVNGVAAGAGANIALACDIVIAARSAKFIQSFANIGLIPDTGGTWILPRLVGLSRAMGLALTGEPLSAERAEQWGLIWKCVDDDTLAEAAETLAKKFASGPTLGLAATKQRLRAAMLNSFDDELDAERDAMRTLGYSRDYAEGVAAFTGKRQPAFTGQ
jgi:2-(1,2-epoxy-1,2-dihydrophenyl)acetyl-CoA isomerase